MLNMKNKWITNKVTIIVALIVFIVICVGIGALVAPNSEKRGDSDTGIESEQKEDDATISEDTTDKESDKKEESNAGLEVHETYDNNTQDKSDASGNWGDDTTSETPKKDAANGNKEDQDKNNNSNDGNQEEILKDDIDWGEIY